MRDKVFTVVFIIGNYLTYFIGETDTPFKVLCLLLILDYVLGTIVAVVFKKSKKTESGKVNSAVGFKGLLKKFAVLVIVGVANQLDLVMGTEMVRGGAILAFISNESLSICENVTLMGVVLPKPVTDALDIISKGE